MKSINFKVQCDVPEKAKLKGFIFETEKEIIINLHTQKIPEGNMDVKIVG